MTAIAKKKQGPARHGRRSKPAKRVKRIAPIADGQIDSFLEQMDDPDYWRTFTDPLTGDRITLTADEIDVIKRLRANDYADASYDPHAPSVDFFTYKRQVEPVLSRKRRVPRKGEPSRWEAKKIARLVRAIRRGIISIDDILHPEKRRREKDSLVYDLWGAEGDARFGGQPAPPLPPIAAPRMRLPSHGDSYNPPPEFLPTPEERAAWEQKPADARPPFLPTRHRSLRLLPAYPHLVHERFSRCLDLFMCPRGMRQKLAVADADDLLPTLPDPRLLRPFPTTRSTDFVGHDAAVQSLSVDPSGQWLLTASRDSTVRLWEVASGQCIRSWPASDAVVAWNPNVSFPLFAMTDGQHVHIVVPPGIPRASQAEQVIASYDPASSIKSAFPWTGSFKEDDSGIRLSIPLPATATGIAWHGKGDYFAVLCPTAASLSSRISVHQLTRRATQLPFRRLGGSTPRAISFYPKQPSFAIATDRSVRIYDLVRQQLTRRLQPSIRHISGMAVHHSGDHVLIGSLDRAVQWFDLDGSSAPLRSLQQPAPARAVAFSPHFPLFATALDNGRLQITHASVSDDLRQDPVIVPVKLISTAPDDDEQGAGGVMQVCWHPTQPWVFAGMSDGRVSLFV